MLARSSLLSKTAPGAVGGAGLGSGIRVGRGGRGVGGADEERRITVACRVKPREPGTGPAQVRCVL